MKRLLIELQYLPPVSYFALLQGFETVTVEKFEHYQKQTFRNRCYIKSASGVEILTIPLIHDPGKTPVCKVRIDYSQKWLNSHWRTIQSAYGNAPFFEYYQQDLHDTFYRKIPFLYELNLELLRMCLRWLKYNISVSETTFYQKEAGTEITDYRSVLNPKKPERCNDFYHPVEYQQVFGNKFVSNLSIIDLIFCEGPGALTVIRASAAFDRR